MFAKLREALLILALVLLLFTSFSIHSGNHVQSVSHPSEVVHREGFKQTSRSFVLSDNTPHDPIAITYNGGFGILGFPGNGTANNPYVISNLDITTTAQYQHGISIANVDAVFVVSNCTISADNGIVIENSDNFILDSNHIMPNFPVGGGGLTGISIIDGNEFTVSNNEISQSGESEYAFNFGMYVDNSHDSTIENNTVRNCDFPMQFYGSNLTVAENMIVGGDFTYDGLAVNGISNSEITGNRVSGCDNGIYLTGSNNSIVQNTCYENRVGIYLSNSIQNTISNNSLLSNDNDGIVIYSDSSSNIISKNLLEGNGGPGVSLRPYTPTMTFFPTLFPEGNQVFSNIFIGNNGFGPQASDPSGGNSFVHNYWSDQLLRIDLNGDGFTDLPFVVEGVSVIDASPLVSASMAYSLDIESIPLQSNLILPIQRNSLLFLIVLLLPNVLLIWRLSFSKKRKVLPDSIAEPRRNLLLIFNLQIILGISGLLVGVYSLLGAVIAFSVLLGAIGLALIPLGVLQMLVGIRFFDLKQQTWMRGIVTDAACTVLSSFAAIIFMNYLLLALPVLNCIILVLLNRPSIKSHFVPA